VTRFNLPRLPGPILVRPGAFYAILIKPKMNEIIQLLAELEKRPDIGRC